MEVLENNSRFFDFEKAKVQELTLNQLRKTHKENDVYGNPLQGVHHYEIIENLMEAADKRNLNLEIYDLFAAQNKDKNQPGVIILPQVETIYGERAVEAHVLRRVFANIRIKDYDNEEMTTNMAVAFHQGGIQVGFGNMVKVCHNQCMLGAEQSISTFGKQKASIPQLLETAAGWLDKCGDLVITERRTIERMKAYDVDADQMFRIIGMLTALRVAKDTKNKDIRVAAQYPLNQAQISMFTEALMTKSFEQDSRLSLWDVYNCANELYKGNSMEIPNILPQNVAMSSFLKENFLEI